MRKKKKRTMENIEAYLQTEYFNFDKARGEEELANFRDALAEKLKGDMGRDIEDVLSGKVKVDIPLRRRIAFRIKCFFNKLFEKI